ncbi:MAG TPA: polysaccharide deacetylase family protein [Vicinamibacterales bacterium]|nr:polysaccharide deacetylase family protein [Vicinamibacterales bacterium]
MKLFAIALFALVATASVRTQPAPAPAPVYVVLWFDEEDYILPQDDDATLRLAQLLTKLDVRATFKIVGEKARVLEQRRRTDVIAALKRHEIGYHSNTHSQQPTVAVYLQNAGWENGSAEFYRREMAGVRDIQRIFGVTPSCYGQPGSSWAPQTYPALRRMGIRMYLDEADHVGIDDQPFYYARLLNVFKMRSNLARMELAGGNSLPEGKARFTAAYEKLRAQGGGTISIYYHPSEWVHAEFWDGVNFSHGANPPRDQWKLPRTRPAAETDTAFGDFEAYIQFIKTQPGVRFVTANEMTHLFEDQAGTHEFVKDDLVGIARKTQQEITFQRFDGYALSAADAFVLLTGAMASYLPNQQWPPTTALTDVYGPAQGFSASIGGVRPASVPWDAFGAAVKDTAAYLATYGRIPDEVWIGSQNLSPTDYLATLADVTERIASGGAIPADVTIRQGHFTADRYVADDSTDLWGWVIFPDGFHAPHIVELAKLQAWTLKPAVAAKAR